MGRILLLAASLAACAAAAAFAAESIPKGKGLDERQLAALSQYEEASRKVDQAEAFAQQARSDYDRTKASKRLAAAQDDLAEARQQLKELGVSVPDKRGSSSRDEESESKVPDVGPGRALDPRVDHHSWVGEPNRGPVKPIERPTPPEDSLKPSAVDAGEEGQVLYGRVPSIGGGSNPRGTPGGRGIRDDGGRGPADGGPIALPTFQQPQDRDPVLPQTGPVDDGLPARKGVDFILESRPWTPMRAGAGGRPGRAGDEERAALVRSVQRSLGSGDAEAALRDVDRLCRLAPSDAGARHLRAMVLDKLERFGEAAAEAREAIRLGAGGASVYETLAWAQLHLGQYGAAAESASTAIRLDPEATLAYVIRAHAFERLGDQRGKVADITKAAAQKPAQYAGMAARAQAGGSLSSPTDNMPHVVAEPADRGAASSLPGLAVGLGAAVAAGILGAVLLGRKRRNQA